MALGQICLACGVFYVGFQVFSKRRVKKKVTWLERPNSPTKKSFFPSATRVYIVRSWKEQTRQADPTVMRYVLEIPNTGQRMGYTSIETLMDSLLTELTWA